MSAGGSDGGGGDKRQNVNRVVCGLNCNENTLFLEHSFLGAGSNASGIIHEQKILVT